MKTFEELGLIAPICKAISEIGYENPMSVQEEVIPYLLGEPMDLIALAQTGTGKTAAFGLPLLQNISVQNVKSKHPKALVLCPTRELCLQISDDLTEYSKYIPQIKILPVYGGSSIESQIKILKSGVDVIVATPGRLMDLMDRGVASLEMINTVVLDEADEMLNMGFAEAIETILSKVPIDRHMLLFSATMPKQISIIANKFLKKPKEITIGAKNIGNANINHIYYVVASKHRYLALKRIVDYYPNIYGIVFCRTRAETQEIAECLIKDGYNADSLHGELSQAQRDNVMQRFRIRNIQLLVATDVAARGLDVNDLTHVIHYGLPDDVESYTHRSGRTARAGKKGLSIAICHNREGRKLKEIERIIKSNFVREMLPSNEDICKKQLMNMTDRIERVVVPDDDSLNSFMPDIYRKLSWLDKDELILRIMNLEFERLIKYYDNVESIDEADAKGRLEGSSSEKSGKKSKRQSDENFTRLFINVGKTDRIYPNTLIELINKKVAGRVKIGKIDIMNKFSFFEVDRYDADDVVSSLTGSMMFDRQILVEVAQEDKSDKKKKKNKESVRDTDSKKDKSKSKKDKKSDKKENSKSKKGSYFEKFYKNN